MSAVASSTANLFVRLFGPRRKSRTPARPAPPVGPAPNATPVIPEGFKGMTEFDRGDIFVAGYPKSGNTWFQELTAAVMYGLIPRYAPPYVVHDLVPDVHFRPFYRRHGNPMFFKTHHLPRPEYQRVIYLLRDGRDAMISYWHWFTTLYRREVDLLEMVATGKDLFPENCKWHTHVEAWLANPYGAHMMIVRYEDLLANTVRELERLCEFVGIQRERSFLEMMAGEATFEKMREREARLKRVNGLWPAGKYFRRRGVVGSYKDEMPAPVLEAFMREGGDTLRKVGYA